jgi:hypothetical protein
VNWIALMIKQVWYKTDKNPAANLSFEPQVWIQLLRSWVPSLVMTLYSYLRNSLIFPIVEMHNKGKHHLKHWSSPILHTKKEASHWD